MTWMPIEIATLKVIVDDRENCSDCTPLRPCSNHAASAIGRAIGKSRHAVIGWMNRHYVKPEPESEPEPEPEPESEPKREPAAMIHADQCASQGCPNPPRRYYNDRFCAQCRRRHLDDRQFYTDAEGRRRQRSTAGLVKR